MFTSEELSAMASRLEMHDAVFSQLWQVGKPVYDTKIKTAAVEFDNVGQCVNFYINPKFWAQQTDKQKDFIVCHEMLHIILEHGRRTIKEYTPEANNIAMDVVVNEMLATKFGFDRKQIDPTNRLCWLNTVFAKKPNVLPDQTFEYYMLKLIEMAEANKSGKGKNIGGGNGKGKGQGGQVLDDHSKLGNEDAEALAERIADRLAQEEKEQFAEKLGKEGEGNGQQAGSSAGGFTKVMDRKPVRKKRKWETLIKKQLKKMAGEGLSEQWFASNRRLAAMNSSKIILPSEVEYDGVETKKSLVYMFLDTSGSCADLAPRFWHLAMSVPREHFDLRLRCFDTRVYEINMKDRKLRGFGGTSFRIIEEHIQREIASEKIKHYPDAVFILTDGYGNQVNPQKPDSWHVLLTTGDRSCFPSEVHTYNLRDFE